MNKNYLFLTVLMLALAIGTLFLNKEKDYEQIRPTELLWDIIQPTRYVSTDQVAKMIIAKDPTLELVDVRDADSYGKFSLPNAVNVPLNDILKPENQDYFGLPGVKVVFYSNDDIRADQAWVITKRMGYNETYVLKGGLNCWFETIINPKEPSPEAPYVEFEKYQFRKGAQMFFTGVKVESTSKKKGVKVKRRKKAAVASGGC